MSSLTAKVMTPASRIALISDHALEVSEVFFSVDVIELRHAQLTAALGGSVTIVTLNKKGQLFSTLS